MLIKSDQSLLLLIDLQEKLAPAIEDIDAVLRHNLWLVDVARRLSVPVGATVQYPSGLGPMVPELGARIEPDEIVEKIHFSAVTGGCLEALPDFSRRYHQHAMARGLVLRPIGKTLYAMPPYVLDNEAVQCLAGGALDALNATLQEEI